MRNVHIGKLTLHTRGDHPDAARTLGQRVAERLGAELPSSSVASRRHATVDVTVPSGLSGEQFAAFVAREIQRRLR
jgi:hypothetical protein